MDIPVPVVCPVWWSLFRMPGTGSMFVPQAAPFPPSLGISVGARPGWEPTCLQGHIQRFLVAAAKSRLCLGSGARLASPRLQTGPVGPPAKSSQLSLCLSRPHPSRELGLEP